LAESLLHHYYSQAEGSLTVEGLEAIARFHDGRFVFFETPPYMKFEGTLYGKILSIRLTEDSRVMLSVMLHELSEYIMFARPEAFEERPDGLPMDAKDRHEIALMVEEMYEARINPPSPPDEEERLRRQIEKPRRDVQEQVKPPYGMDGPFMDDVA